MVKLTDAMNMKGIIMATKPKNEQTSSKVATIASQAMRDPKSLSPKQIKTLGASALTQTADKKKK